MPRFYGSDLAHIHDVGHADYARLSAPYILQQLHQHGIQAGLVVELGCGSGWSAQAFVQARFQVFGVDISEALVGLARDRVPTATFQVASLYDVDLPPCQAVISIGECLNYYLEATPPNLPHLFRRIHQALIPGGLFIFDIAEPGQVPTQEAVKTFSEGPDWFVLLEKSEDPTTSILTRRIITLRQQGADYRRDEEIHHLKLWSAGMLVNELNRIGFQCQCQSSYGDFQLPPAHTVVIAHKPSSKFHNMS